MSTQESQRRDEMTRAMAAFRRGGVVLVSDGARPARGGIVVAAAERTSDDVINFMATHACGLISLAITPTRSGVLGLRAVGDVYGLERERFTVSVEAREGVSTGISAADRARTIQACVHHHTRADDLVRPGHVFPIIAEPGGVVVRAGWAEAGLDLARISGTQPAATICQVLDQDAEIATGDTLDAFAVAHGLPHITIGDIISHRMATETFVTQLGQSLLPTAYGEFVVRAFRNELTGRQHLALTLGAIRTPEPILVRLHSECLTGDVFGSRRCDCGAQLTTALQRIQAAGSGVVLYLRQEGRGIGLANKLRAYSLQDAGRDTVEANVELGLPVDQRDYGIAAQMLLALGAHRVRLMTNNPRKVAGLTAGGVMVVARDTIEVPAGADNRAYLKTKKEKLGHLLEGTF